MKRIFSGAPWETKVGYCRAVRSGNFIAISGTAPIGADGHCHAPGDGPANAYEQARKCLEIIDAALRELGAEPKDIVRTRMFVTDIGLWEHFGRAHREFFVGVQGSPTYPATSMLEIKSLILPGMLIEIEADALLSAE